MTPENYLRDLINEGYDYEIMTLEISELKRVNRRGNPNKNKDLKSKLDIKLYWIGLYEEEKSIKYIEIFQGIEVTNYNLLYQKWEEYLSENLEFPIETTVVESERGRIRNGAMIKLLNIDDFDDMYGVFGIGKYGREAITFPICNLEAINKKSNNYELLRDYAIWFANM